MSRLLLTLEPRRLWLWLITDVSPSIAITPQMKEFNWPRILVCGLVAGGVWTALSVILLALVGDEFLTAVRQGRTDQGTGSSLFLVFMNLGAGIWAVWLYAALRPRYGAGLKSALAASLAWWLISSMQSAKWMALLGITPSMAFAPFVATLLAIIAATLVGAWFYEK